MGPQDSRRAKKQKLICNAEEELESKLGFDLFADGEKRIDGCLTFHPHLGRMRIHTKFIVVWIFILLPRMVLCSSQSTDFSLISMWLQREFAPEAEFRDLSHSFILPNVICSYCIDCRDLDLCRDSALLSQEWNCGVPQCGQPYDREVMENALLQIVRQRERLYHLQDLVCVRCYQVKAAHLAEYFACAGSYKCKEDRTEFCNKMQVFYNIAVSQKFQLLQECTSWILELR